MNLEWFRQHKKFVYWVLLPIVGGGMVFFGASSALQRGSLFSRAHGTGISYYKGDSLQYMSPDEVYAYRLMIAHYNSRGNATSQDVSQHMSQYSNALDQGFEIGEAEQLERLRQAVKQRTQQSEASEEIYKKLLKHLNMTAGQFEKMSREDAIIQKSIGEVFEHVKVDDGELFEQYCKDKEVVRLRFKPIRSEEFIVKAEAPTEDKIKDFYESNKTNVKDLKDVMFTKPKLSADMLFLDTEKLFGGELKPTDDDLKKVYEQFKGTLWKTEVKPGEKLAAGVPEFKAFDSVKADVEKKWKEEQIKTFYDRHKNMYWKIAPKTGEAPPPPGEEKVKPFEEVKAEVETKWKADWEANEKKERAMARMSKLKQDLTDAEAAWNTEQEKKPEKERKPFDMDAWAKTQGLTHWTTKEMTQEEFQKGKEEVGALDAQWPSRLFFMYEPSEYSFVNENNKKMQKEFSYPIITGKGAVMQRVKTYVSETPKPLAEAHDAIVARMKIYSSIELAHKEAEKVREAWDRGKDLPPIDSLEEVSGDSKSNNPLVEKFFDSPQAIGEVLPVAEGPADDVPMSKNPNRKFYVGFAVERQLPTWQTFHDDTAWDRDQNRNKIWQTHAMFVQTIMSQKSGTAPIGDEIPLNDEMRRGSGAPIDDGF